MDNVEIESKFIDQIWNKIKYFEDEYGMSQCQAIGALSLIVHDLNQNNREDQLEDTEA